MSKSNPRQHCAQTDSPQTGFFLVEFADGSRIVYIKENNAKFPLQFGRYAASHNVLLGFLCI